MQENELQKVREQCLKATAIKLKASVNEDNFISQAINSIQEIEKVANTLSKRLREWYALYNPEFVRSIQNNEKFSELIVTRSREDLLKEINISESIGADLNETDLNAILDLAKTLQSLYKQREQARTYLEEMMKTYSPNLLAVAGSTIGAKLLEHAGSLKKLVIMPSSTIQILGAEKALFRHIKTGARPPRHGLIIDHPLIASASQKDHGKRARALADKILLACKLDYFKGEYKGDQLRKELEEKFSKK